MAMPQTIPRPQIEFLSLTGAVLPYCEIAVDLIRGYESQLSLTSVVQDRHCGVQGRTLVPIDPNISSIEEISSIGDTRQCGAHRYSVIVEQRGGMLRLTLSIDVLKIHSQPWYCLFGKLQEQ